MANLGVALVGEENGRRVASRDEQDWRREELDGGEVPVREGRRGGAREVQWVTRKLARGCSGRRMAGGVLPTVTRGGGGRAWPRR
jgi:hypothetical protein